MELSRWVGLSSCLERVGLVLKSTYEDTIIVLHPLRPPIPPANHRRRPPFCFRLLPVWWKRWWREVGSTTAAKIPGLEGNLFQMKIHEDLAGQMSMGVYFFVCVCGLGFECQGLPREKSCLQ